MHLRDFWTSYQKKGAVMGVSLYSSSSVLQWLNMKTKVTCILYIHTVCETIFDKINKNIHSDAWIIFYELIYES